MKYITIMITLLLFSSTLLAKQSSHTRAKMLLTGKYLTQRYETLDNRLAAWIYHKTVLIENFKKTDEEKNDFGYDNYYGSQRQMKRRTAFYDSLEKREKEITVALTLVSDEFEALNIKFLHRYGVALSKNEMFQGVAPAVKDREQKISLLRRYLKAQKSWKSCLRQVDKFDAKRVALDERTNISDKIYNSLSLKLDTKVEKNFLSIEKYEDALRGAVDTYALEYGCTIADETAAKLLLKNIQKSH